MPFGSSISFNNTNQTSAFDDLSVSQLTPCTAWLNSVNINSDLVTSTTTGSGTVTFLNGQAVLSTTAAINSSARITSKKILRYLPGIGGLARFTAVFTAGVANSTQVIGLVSLDENDGLAFGYNGTSFGIVRISNGSSTWVAQTSWNKNKGTNDGVSPFTLDPTKGNVYQIRFQYLGYGQIDFSVENPNTGKFELLHSIQYANINTVPSMRNPHFVLSAKVTNTSNNTNIALSTPSAVGFIEGFIQEIANNHPLTIHRTLRSAKTGITTETNIITIQNKSTYASANNRIRVRARKLDASSDGTKSVLFNCKLNATLGGSPSYTDISTNTSPLSYDTAGTTVTGGTLVFAKSIAKVSDFSEDLHEYDILLNPGDIFTISATSASSTDVDLSIILEEYH